MTSRLSQEESQNALRVLAQNRLLGEWRSGNIVRDVLTNWTDLRVRVRSRLYALSLENNT